MRTMFSFGLSACSTSQPRPSFSSAPGFRFSISRSASASRRFTSLTPSGDFKLMEMDFLFRDCRYHHSEVPWCSLRHLRKGSPSPGASILITSAPNSPSRRAAKGAAISAPISMTLIPASGPLISISSLYGRQRWQRALRHSSIMTLPFSLPGRPPRPPAYPREPHVHTISTRRERPPHLRRSHDGLDRPPLPQVSPRNHPAHLVVHGDGDHGRAGLRGRRAPPAFQ